MADSAVRDSGDRRSFKPRARIMRTLGDELISSDTVAIIELVKNSYDADATRVLVRFNPPLERQKGSIEVIDNGCGMHLDTVMKAWMEPATVFKKRNKVTGSGRRVLGEKGIGRFASSRLADELYVITRPEDDPREVQAYFDWRQFDDEDKYLEDVDVLFEEGIPKEIVSNGYIEALWNEGLWEDEEYNQSNSRAHGTILRMESLRSDWNERMLLDLRTGLSRLVSPFIYEENTDVHFKIALDFPQPFAAYSGQVGPPEVLRHPHYLVKGEVERSGKFILKVRLKNNEEDNLTGQFLIQEGDDGRWPTCGKFSVELRVWDRDRDSLAELTELQRHDGADGSRSTIKDVRRDLDAVSGINIYRDGFRVLPYGEPKNDWLRLDARRVQNPTLRLSNNQIVGYILISADSNPELRDQSNREGLIDNVAFSDLQELVLKILALLETRRYDMRRGNEKEVTEDENSAVSFKASLAETFQRLHIDDVESYVSQTYAGDEQLNALIESRNRALHEEADNIREVIARYRRLSTLGMLIDSVLHNGRTPLGKIRSRAGLARRSIERREKECEELLVELQSKLTMIDNQAEVLATVFNRIEPFGGRKRGRPKQIILESVISRSFNVLSEELERAHVRYAVSDTRTEVTLDEAEVSEVLVNLIENSIYWLKNTSKDKREIKVLVERKSEDLVEITYSDSGPGVDPDIRGRIFDPYFTQKPRGVGIGLTIAGEIITEYYDGDFLLVNDGPLPGATFLIRLRKRV